MSDHRLAILAYHSIGEPPPEWWSWYYVSEATFAGHLEVLRANGWVMIGRSALVAGLADPSTLPPRSAVITFDDGYQSFGSTALPILQAFAVPSILFVPTGHVGASNRWDFDVEPEAPVCTWTDLISWSRAGVSIQSHGASHRAFSQLTASERSEEVRRSRHAIEDRVGASVDMLSFPYGDDGADRDDTARLLRTAGYLAACLYGGGPVIAEEADRYALPRIAVGPETDIRAALASGSPECKPHPCTVGPRLGPVRPH